MGAVRAEALPIAEYRQPKRIRVPEDLNLPLEVAELVDHLTPEQTRKLTTEIIDALEKSQGERDLFQVWRVLESWHRTIRLIQAPGFIEAWKSEEESHPMTSEEVAEFLNIAV